MPEFNFEHLLPGAGGNGEPETPWRLLTTDGVSSVDGLPTGIQFLAPVLEDARLYRVGAALEAALLEQWGGPLAPSAYAQGGK